MKSIPRANPAHLPKLRRWIHRLIVLVLLLLPVSAVSGADTGPFTVFLPYVSSGCSPTVLPTGGSWLEYVNFYRDTACLPHVAEDLAMSDGDQKHARYIVKNDILQHDEDPANPWYTPEGRTAAQQSNLAASTSTSASDVWAFDTWMQAPFHAVGLLDPKLDRVGYGSYHESDGGLQTGVGVNVIAGRNFAATPAYPVIWPAQGMTVPIRLHWGESPSPLTSCPGYQSPSGLPVIVQFGDGSLTPVVSASSFSNQGTSLEHCVFSEETYTHPDSAQQSLGRSILNSRDAVVLIPRQPLLAGQTYTASLTVNGQTYAWSFTISVNPH